MDDIAADIPAADAARTVRDALLSRRSVRAFLSTQVPQSLIGELLSLAARAPSGGNIQPWKVHVVFGRAKTELEKDLLATAADKNGGGRPEYDYYPRQWWEPYASRRSEIGLALYGTLGIGKRDVAARRAQHMRNFAFFGAPAGLFFCVERALTAGSWLDVGMFLQSFMLAAREAGLHTCPQAAFTSHHEVVRRHLAIPDGDILLCGMALGYEDTTRPENALRSPRAPLDQFVRFHGD
ncbi:nitroreductase [Ramlibacter sp.]|uniref:nitroreductase n=1 Tax=Ramlibacter sp. TaxID=1917967 RepID=UPI0017F8C212|nr:nitroreductase [Ramlibacter sp.]MBA2673898.1 nitroreductase [Ramlibacter sp.]